MLTSEKDFRTKNITRDKERYFIMLKEIIHQEVIAYLYIKKKLIEPKNLFRFYYRNSL